MDWPGGERKSFWEQHESKSWHCSVTKTISRIRVRKVEQEFERISSKKHQEDCFLSWWTTTQEPLKEGLDSPPAATSLENSCPASPTPSSPGLFTGYGFPLTQLSTRFELAGLTQALSLARLTEHSPQEGSHTVLGTRKHTHTRAGTPLKVKGNGEKRCGRGRG